jgi:hypothetical protein
MADLPNSLKETSVIEIAVDSNLLWVVEDSGNKNELYGLDGYGKIAKHIKIKNQKNKDWEDLASDSLGNIYIGDFGNNNKKRTSYNILKIISPGKSGQEVEAESIEFTLPEKSKPQDFEAFFLLEDHFYIFSKSRKHGKLFKVPNHIGKQMASHVTDFNLKGKNNAITAADHYNGQVALLNHDKVWILSNFKGEDFFNGDIEALDFEHRSQKEGITFKNDSTLIITDEFTDGYGGNIYEFNLN